MHQIVYDNAQSDWNEALPMGNGVFGGMVYFRDNCYTVAMNHYEVYYSICQKFSPSFTEKTYEEYMQEALKNTRDYTREAFLHYRKTIWPSADTVKQEPMHQGVSQIPTGEFIFSLADSFSRADNYRLQLDIEAATARLTAERAHRKLTVETITLADCDAILNTFRQTEPGCVKELLISYPCRRNHVGLTCEFHTIDTRTFCYSVSYDPQKAGNDHLQPFRFLVMFRLIGAEGAAVVDGNQMHVKLEKDSSEYHVLTYVLTELQSRQLEQDALLNTDHIRRKLETHLDTHRVHWQTFFGKSKVILPDKFLERLWYYSFYILGCSSGKNGRRFEQASGLNGLWDIRQPTIWGSLWYWDVNIQASYWPVYTANHLELAEVFNDGFLSYARYAEKRAREFYHANGYAIDYPFEFYNCIWPWCAQFLWWYYEYTQDTTFLREKAYPMFREQIAFIQDIIHFDEEKGTYFFFPDVSPEQGPITCNSTITVSTVKYLLKAAIKANEILHESAKDKATFEELLTKLPAYPVGRVDHYGEVFKDSELAPPDISLRHPSLLMPIFPAGEISSLSDERIRQIAENTVNFVSEHTEIGVFPFGWISAAAARLGKGSMALRVLYEQGIDLILRSNGMGAEETDRWINHCNVDFGQLYYPSMMECVGEFAACVNEMLLQSLGDVISVFPALPNGDAEPKRGAYRPRPLVEPTIPKHPPVWEDCYFEGFLGKGGFEVSALLKGGKLRYIKIKSRFGLPIKLKIPHNFCEPTVETRGTPVSFELKNGILSFETAKGAEYLIADRALCGYSEEPDSLQAYQTGFHYVSHLGRRVFAGKDRNTDTIKLLDAFLYDYYVANGRCHQVIPYRFSFGLDEAHIQKQIEMPEYKPQNDVEKRFLKITPYIRYTGNLGLGFQRSDGLSAVDTARGNCLLRDFITGRTDAVFAVELPKGIYQMLAVSTGTEEKSVTKIAISGGNSVHMEAEAGEYKSGILFVEHKNCGPLELQISSEEGSAWNLDLLIVRKVSSLM